MSLLTATWRGLAVFAYFFVTTVWLPDLVLGMDAVAGASDLVRDTVGLVIWSIGLGAGLWMLRRAQQRGLI